MNKTKAYLIKRVNELNNKRNKSSVAYKQNHIIMLETSKAIEKIKSISDEALEIFSPKARENTSFNKQEVNDLELKIVTLSQQNKDLNAEIKRLESEIKMIHECIDEIEEDEKLSAQHKNVNEQINEKENKSNVSRETFDKNITNEKLKQIKELIFCDQQRAVIEIDELINK